LPIQNITHFLNIATIDRGRGEETFLAFGNISPYIATTMQHAIIKQKSRLFFIASWLALRLRWSMIFLRTSFSDGGLQHFWTKPGVILFSRRHNRFPLARWSFDESHSAYIYSSQLEESLRVCRLPEISRN